MNPGDFVLWCIVKLARRARARLRLEWDALIEVIMATRWGPGLAFRWKCIKKDFRNGVPPLPFWMQTALATLGLLEIGDEDGPAWAGPLRASPVVTLCAVCLIGAFLILLIHSASGGWFSFVEFLGYCCFVGAMACVALTIAVVLLVFWRVVS
jgi:hypothetical protein